MKTPVSSPLAKLVKEKGFDKPVHQYYQFIRDLSSKQDKTWQLINSSFLVRESDAAMFPDEGKNGVEVSAYSDRIYRDYNFKTSEDFISAPTIAEVVMWFYEKDGVWIEVTTNNNPQVRKEFVSFDARVIHRDRNIKFRVLMNTQINKYTEPFNSPTEAYEAAVEYVLNNLI